MASRLFGRTISKSDKRERETGKVTCLASGYGIGAKGFAAYCERSAIDLEGAGLTAAGVIETYRESVPQIAGPYGLWKSVEKAAKNAIRGHPSSAGRCAFRAEGNALIIELPSRRKLYYRHPRIVQRTKTWGVTDDIVYDASGREGAAVGQRRTGKQTAGKGGHGFAEYTYGGKLVENIVQAVCRDLLADAMVRCERDGLPIVLICHDEIAVELPAEHAEEGLRRPLTIMSSPPSWAEGFPVAVEGYISTRYAKSPIPKSPTLKAQNGRLS
jgi:DNA polymerase